MNIEESIRKIIQEEIKKYFDCNQPNLQSNLFKKIEEMEFSIRTINTLTKFCKLVFLGDLVCNEKLNYKQGNLYYWVVFLFEPNFGMKSYRELLEVLSFYGFNKTIECEDFWIKRKQLTQIDPDFDLVSKFITKENI